MASQHPSSILVTTAPVAYGFQPPLFPDLEEEVSCPSVQAFIRCCRRTWTQARATLLCSSDRTLSLYAKWSERGKGLLSVGATVRGETTKIQKYIGKMDPDDELQKPNNEQEEDESSWKDKTLHGMYKQQMEELAEMAGELVPVIPGVSSSERPEF
ncbi:hypothetical protein L3Q82_001637 [Scortum barcoo]|uniref:Uncharacterized protein n=1 Tax=Scortum barcoo TaxID=214431 RepID=A0ACB8W624_9TELE|nr:hypothetical protein L3Q82_001637 [Scortum barcoo]